MKIYNSLQENFPGCVYNMENKEKHIDYSVKCNDFALHICYKIGEGNTEGELIVKGKKMLTKQGNVNDIINWAKTEIYG